MKKIITILKLLGFFIIGSAGYGFFWLAIGPLALLIVIILQCILVFKKKHPFKRFIIPTIYLIIYLIVLFYMIGSSQARYNECYYFQIENTFNLMPGSYCEDRIEDSLYTLSEYYPLYGGLVGAAIWYSSDKEYKKMIKEVKAKAKA